MTRTIILNRNSVLEFRNYRKIIIIIIIIIIISNIMSNIINNMFAMHAKHMHGTVFDRDSSITWL